MATVSVTLTTKKQNVPSLPAASNTLQVKLMQGSVQKNVANVQLPQLNVTFNGVADGDYTVIAQRLNMQSQPIGDAATSATFSVVNTTDIDVPDTVQVSVS